MKILLISYCENCCHLLIEGEEDLSVEVYRCGHKKSLCKGVFREIIKSNEIPDDDAIIIPKWCPLEDI